MNPIRICISDPHFGDGSKGDRCLYPAVRRAVQLACDTHAAELVILGDFFERWKFGWNAIYRHNASFLRVLGTQLTKAEVPVTYLLGNHDYENGSTQLWEQRLRALGFPCTVHSDHVHRGVWQLEHGHRFDWMCRESKGPWDEISQTAAWLAGRTIERVLPSVHWGWANPANWFGDKTAANRALVADLAVEWAARRQEHLVFGHTHECFVDGEASWCVANTGALTTDVGQLQAVLLTDAGEVNTLRERV